MDHIENIRRHKPERTTELFDKTVYVYVNIDVCKYKYMQYVTNTLFKYMYVDYLKYQ